MTGRAPFSQDHQATAPTVSFAPPAHSGTVPVTK